MTDEQVQEDVIRRARDRYPNDERLVESSSDDDVRRRSFEVASDLLGEQA